MSDSQQHEGAGSQGRRRSWRHLSPAAVQDGRHGAGLKSSVYWGLPGAPSRASGCYLTSLTPPGPRAQRGTRCATFRVSAEQHIRPRVEVGFVWFPRLPHGVTTCTATRCRGWALHRSLDPGRLRLCFSPEGLQDHVTGEGTGEPHTPAGTSTKHSHGPGRFVAVT